MYASFPTDSKFFAESKWWIGEKYDGIRYCWNPIQSQVYSRTGNEFSLLPSLISKFPSVFLDGELWFGRGQFTYTFALVSGSVDLVHWHMLRIISFDTPDQNLHNMKFEDRYKHVLQHSGKEIIVAPRIESKKYKEVNKFSKNIIKDGGEGVVLRKCGSLYEPGRNSSLYKFKTTYGDREGIVTGKDSQSVHLRLPNGVSFSVPMRDVEISVPIVTGTVVTFSYDINSRRDVPVNPKIIRIREDIDWADVCSNFFNEQKIHGFTSQAQGYWTPQKMRNVLESIAKSKGFDPLRVETWYNIPDEIFYKDKAGRMVVQKHGGYSNAVSTLFPELKFEHNSFRPSWRNMQNRRKFFEDYARENKFDPLVPQNWYQQSRDNIMAKQEANRVIYYHKDSTLKALLDLFPEIGLDKSKLWSPAWHEKENRRKFFINFAEENGFDPFNVDSWYSQSKEKIMATKGAKRVIFYHENNIPKSLVNLFPELIFDVSRLSHLESNFGSWQDVDSRRKLFENYAKDNNFDPLDPEMWYQQPRKKILAVKGTATVISYYDYSVAKALIDCFPNIGLDSSKFPWTPPVWYEAENRRKFFENYAAEHGIDPLIPENWFSQSREKIFTTKGAASVVSYHKGSVSKALRDLFPEVSWGHSTNSRTWKDAGNRREFFESFATQNGFDFLNSENWYLQSRDKILSVQGASSVISYHNNSIAKALVDLFPDVKFNVSNFKWAQPMWREAKNRRKFFENYAKDNKFDPLIVQSWYEQPLEKVLSVKGASKVISYHKTAPRALMELFPEIIFDKHKLWPTPVHGVENTRNFFERYARENEFDPLIAENWYLQTKRKISSSKGAWDIISFHKNNISKALRECFPNIGLQKSKLSSLGP